MIGVATVEPAPGMLGEFARCVPDGQPIVMINLLRYREWAALEGERLTGRQCYERYAEAVLPLLIAAGGRLIWRGRATFSLIGPHTVNTLPPATLAAFNDHGVVAVTIRDGLAEAKSTLAAIEAQGISVERVCAELLSDGVASFAKSFTDLLGAVETRRKSLAASR